MCDNITVLRACLQGGRVTQASELTLAGREKIARVYKQNFTGTTTRENLARDYTQRVWKIYKGKSSPACQGNPSMHIG